MLQVPPGRLSCRTLCLLSSCCFPAASTAMLRTALQGDVSFDKVTDELLAQHSRIHEREKKIGAPRRGYPTRAKGEHGGWHPTGYYTEEIEDEPCEEDDLFGLWARAVALTRHPGFPHRRVPSRAAGSVSRLL